MAGRTPVACTLFVPPGADTEEVDPSGDAVLRTLLDPYARGEQP
ncbi:hypothetical protein ABTZ58_18580 [Streptomyces sp. NPDC094143]